VTGVQTCALPILLLAAEVVQANQADTATLVDSVINPS